MKIHPNSVPKFLRAPTAAVVLVHGDDGGRVREIAASLADGGSGRRVLSLDAEDAVRDPARVHAAGRSPGLFDEGSTPASVRIHGTAAGLDRIVREALEEMNAGARLVVEVEGYLRASSGLRKLFEKDRRAACIACPSPSAANLRAVIDEEARKQGTVLDDGAAGRLLERLPADTGAARAEVAKIALLRPGGTASARDVDAVTGDGSEAGVDETCDAAASGRPGAADAAARRVLAGDVEPVGLLRMTRNHFLRLVRARNDADGGAGPAKAAGRATPPVYGPRRDALEMQLRTWPAADAERAIEKIDAAEARVKLADDAARDALARHVLWEIAWRARTLSARRGGSGKPGNKSRKEGPE